jgi:hypothetical protein
VDDLPHSSHVAEQVHKKIHAAAYVSDFIARQMLYGVKCDVCKTCLTSQVMISTSVFIYFKKYSDIEQSLKYPYEKFVETVGTSVIVMESVGRGGSLEFSGTAYHICH